MVMNEFDPREVPGQSNEEVSGINIQLFFLYGNIYSMVGNPLIFGPDSDSYKNPSKNKTDSPRIPDSYFF